MLAAHAIHVQHGFSTPEIEKARAEKDLARGGTIDWAKMQAEVVAAITADLAKDEEDEAAALEGLAKMPEDLIPLREEKIALDEQIDALTARKKEIQDTFGKRLDERGLVGFLLNGKVHARVTVGTRTGIDGKKLKDEKPSIWKKYLKTTAYRSVRID